MRKFTQVITLLLMAGLSLPPPLTARHMARSRGTPIIPHSSLFTHQALNLSAAFGRNPTFRELPHKILTFLDSLVPTWRDPNEPLAETVGIGRRFRIEVEQHEASSSKKEAFWFIKFAKKMSAGGTRIPNFLKRMMALRALSQGELLSEETLRLLTAAGIKTAGDLIANVLDESLPIKVGQLESYHIAEIADLIEKENLLSLSLSKDPLDAIDVRDSRLGLSNRAKNAMSNFHPSGKHGNKPIFTMKQLNEASDRDFRVRHNLGLKTLDEIIEKRAAFNNLLQVQAVVADSEKDRRPDERPAYGRIGANARFVIDRITSVQGIRDILAQYGLKELSRQEALTILTNEFFLDVGLADAYLRRASAPIAMVDDPATRGGSWLWLWRILLQLRGRTPGEFPLERYTTRWAFWLENSLSYLIGGLATGALAFFYDVPMNFSNFYAASWLIFILGSLADWVISVQDTTNGDPRRIFHESHVFLVHLLFAAFNVALLPAHIIPRVSPELFPFALVAATFLSHGILNTLSDRLPSSKPHGNVLGKAA